jgi:hypothetical protein
MTAATAAFEDPNTLSFLPHHKTSLLRSYINAVATLNEALRVHESVIQQAAYGSTPVELSIRANVRSNAASVVAMSKVLQEQLEPYFDSSSYDHEEIRQIEDRVRYIKSKALKGEVRFSKEE